MQAESHICLPASIRGPAEGAGQAQLGKANSSSVHWGAIY